MANIKRTKGEWYILMTKGYEKKSGWVVNVEIDGVQRAFGIDKRFQGSYECTDIASGLAVSNGCRDRSTINNIIDYLSTKDFADKYTKASYTDGYKKRVEDMTALLAKENA